MAKTFIDEARSIVADNISNEGFGAKELASLLGLSTSQTLRKIKAETGKSVTQFIRELRLEKAAKLLKRTDKTASEIAFEVGFSSASYFSKAFTKYYGIAPGEYRTKSKDLDAFSSNPTEVDIRYMPIKKQVLITLVALVLLGVVYFLMKPMIHGKQELPNSIAVLPFRDFSPEDNQWFSDGVSDNILHSLAQMGELSVISFTSSATYRETDKKIPQIAEELGVSYILEGSVTLHDRKIKVITQLIDANDQHVWSKEYSGNFNDVITLQNTIAQEVVNQLKITLNPKEAPLLATYPTDNLEAYNLYLKGKNATDSRQLEELNRNIRYNEQAIALDSTFADAYANLAQSYYYLAVDHHGNPAHHMAKVDAFIEKTLQLDPGNARAWSLKGLRMHYKNWKKAKEYHEKAISLNVNDAFAHSQMATYYLSQPNTDILKFLEKTALAFRLNPLQSDYGENYFHALVINKKFDEAEAHLKNTSFLYLDQWYLEMEAKLMAYREQDWTVAMDFLKNKELNEPDNWAVCFILARMYDGVLNDNDAAIAYYRKAAEQNSTAYKRLINDEYFYVLAEGEKFKKADSLLKSEEFHSGINDPSLRYRRTKYLQWYYYFHKKDSAKLREIAKDSVLQHNYWLQTHTAALLGEREKVDSINKLHYWGPTTNRMWRAWRALLHAILQEQDSMYLYLENSKYDGSVRILPNARPEFDPYRNQERYKNILRENYIPIPGE